MNKFVDDIKQKPHFRLRFYPNQAEKVIISARELKQLLEKSQIKYRERYFPHIRHDEFNFKDNYFEIETKRKYNDEFWRFYQSGQFIYYSTIMEDQLVKNNVIPYWPTITTETPDGHVDILRTIYLITEFYSFIYRVLYNNEEMHSVSIEICVENILNYELFIMDQRRELWDSYKCKTNNIIIPTIFLSRQQIANEWLGKALNTIIYIFERFNWLDIPIDIIKEDQKKLIERRL